MTGKEDEDARTLAIRGKLKAQKEAKARSDDAEQAEFRR
jgi:hypothetical protein